MNMPPGLRKFALLTHITFSVGWFGAVVPYLALAIAGLVSRNPQMVRASYLSMESIGWFVIVPFSLAALATGLVQSLGTQWGLFRHWWIVIKFLLTIVATIVLLRHMEVVGSVARIAAETTTFDSVFRTQQVQLLLHPTGGLLVLLAAMTLSVFKPWGVTPYGRRRSSQPDTPSCVAAGVIAVRESVVQTRTPRWPRLVKIHAIHAIALLLLFVVILHLSGSGIPPH